MLASGAVAQRAAVYPDITVLRSDAAGITFEYRPMYSDDRSISTDNGTFRRPEVRYTVPSGDRQAGSADLRFRAVRIAVPSYRNNSITVEATDAENIPSYDLATVPETVSMDSLGGAVERYRTSRTAATDLPLPASVARIGEIAMVRGAVTAQLLIAPYQYRSATRTLRRYSRIVVRVDFGTPDVRFTAEKDDEVLDAMLLNAPVAKGWSVSPRFQKTAAANSVLSSGNWWKLEVTDEGMYRITASYLKALGVDPASLASIQDVKIFGGDGRVIAENLSAVRPADLPQMAVQYVDNNGNGKFDNDDAVLFYGKGTTGWNYNPSTKEFETYYSPYTNSNYYFLSVGATAPVKSIPVVSILSASGGTLDQTMGKAFFHETKYNMNYSGQQWFSPPMNAGDSRVITNKLNGWIPGTAVTYRFSFYSRGNATGDFTMEESGTPLGTVSIAGYSNALLDEPVANFADAGTLSVQSVPTLTDERSTVKIAYASTGSIALGIIDDIRIFYRQRLTASSDILQFTAPDTNGVVEFSLNGFGVNGIPVYDVSDPGNVRRLTTVTGQVLGAFTFKDTLRNGILRRYWAGTESKFLTPKSFVKIPNSNLHGASGAAFVIITHNDFRSAANRLKVHKESLPAGQKLSTMVVDVDTIYNEFGIGMADPSALRDFIRHASTQWTVKPKYVLLFGDASFDVRGVLNSGRSFVPTFQSEESVSKIYTIANEDYFGCIDPSSPTTLSIAMGRLTPRTPEEADIAVDKIISYESSLPVGDWRNRITIVADDQWTSIYNGERDHSDHAYTLSTYYTPRSFEQNVIYMEAYPAVITASGRRKPEVRTAMLDQVNTGTLILNFIGHGNPKVWAHENILSLDDVRTQFQNGDRLTFIVAATCDWARFDEGGETSSAEEVMFNKKGGAIGVLAATRAVFANENAETNQNFYQYLFSGKPVMRLGDAYMATKNSLLPGGVFALYNAQKYFLLGDPTLRLSVPSLGITVDSLRTASHTAADTLQALSTITIHATVRDTALQAATVNGTATLTVFDAERTKSIETISQFTYKEHGAVIYKGECSVANGRMRATFIVPKDIAYENKNGRISIYFHDGATDGRGFTEDFIVGGTSNTAITDSTGPHISIYLDDLKFRSGDVVTESPTLIVALRDSSGVNSSTNGIGHRIEAWIDDGAKSVDLTETYKGKTDSYQEGTATVALSGLSDGGHTVKVRAWDVLNNSSTAEAYFTVASSSALTISDVFNIPNPVRTRTAFTFRQNQSTPVDVTISIYSVAGRLIHRIERSAVPDRFISIDWDRMDKDGNEVGNGVYLYRVQARTVDGRFSSDATGKMAIVR